MDLLLDACREYLANQSSTLWGRAFDVTKDGPGRDAAAEWLKEQVEAINTLHSRLVSDHIVSIGRDSI